MAFADSRLLIFLVAFALIALEAAWRYSKADSSYDFAGAFGSFGVAFGNAIAGIISGGLLFSVYHYVQGFAIFDIDAGDWRAWAAGFVLIEFLYYWMHRFSHTVRWMWASHAVHHTANEFTLPAAVRLGWTSLISGTWLMFLPAVLIGFPPLMVVTLLAANLKYQFLLHTEAIGRLGPMELLFNTPSHHRVHHSSTEKSLDKNYGGVLIIFDRLFGTFVDERDAGALRYGLTRPLVSSNPFVIALREWGFLLRDVARARSPKQFIAACFARPEDAPR